MARNPPREGSPAVRIRLSLELSVERKQQDAPVAEGPAGTESLVIHQDQPRFIGFRPEQQRPTED